MIARYTLAFSLTFSLLIPRTEVRADDRAEVDCVCPLCKTKFTAILAMSGTQFGMRLDLRPIGPIASPWPMAVCTKCHFVLFKDDDEKFTDAELKTLRAVVDSDAYKKLPATAPSYQRIAMLYEGLKRPTIDIAHAYLRATWQNEMDEKANREMLNTSREWFQKYLDSSPEKDSTWQTAEFLRGELLRRVGKFDEAKTQFDRLAGMKEFEKEPFPDLISRELSLIQAKEKAPKPMRPEKEEEKVDAKKP